MDFFTVILNQVNIYKISVLIYNALNINEYKPHKQKVFGVLNTFWVKKVWGPKS